MSTTQRRIFLSHSHMDNEFGTRLAQDLLYVLKDENAVWYDVLGGLHGGDNWWEKIVEEITSREVFIVILSPDAVQSPWVRDEINLAWKQKNSPRGKLIIPLLYRECSVREDLDTLHVISFLDPRSYEVAFKDVVLALGLPAMSLRQQNQAFESLGSGEIVMVGQMEASFAAQDWPDVIRKADFLIKRNLEVVSAKVYRLQGLAYIEEGELEHAQEALESALALVSDKSERLVLLGDYTALLVRLEQWAKVLKCAREALRLLPNDPGWLAIQQQAQNKLAPPPATPVTIPARSRIQEKIKDAKSGIMGNSSRANDPSPATTGGIKSPRRRITANQITGVLQQAQTYQTQGRFPDAIDLCEQILASGFDRPDVRYFLGWLYQEQQRWDEAIRQFQMLLNDPDYALSCFYALGQCYRAKGNLQFAAMHFDKAIDRVKLDTLALEEADQLVQLCQETAEAHRLLGEQEQAVAVYNTLLSFLRSRGWSDKVAQVEFMLQQIQNAPMPPRPVTSQPQHSQQLPPMPDSATMAFNMGAMPNGNVPPPASMQLPPPSNGSVAEPPDWLKGILSDADKTALANKTASQQQRPEAK